MGLTAVGRKRVRQMKAFRIVVVCFVMLLAVQHVYGQVSTVTGPVMKLLAEALRAETGGRTEIAEEKYQEILKKDPDHYQALVSLSQIKLKRAGDSLDARTVAQCEHYLLRAALNQPHRPEAYLVLAQLRYRLGEITEGDTFAKWARDREPNSREAYALLGQRYENTGNYVAATKEYQAALGHLKYDPYFLTRRYWAASNITTSQWVAEFYPHWQIVDTFDQYGPWLASLLEFNPDLVRRVIYAYLRERLVAAFRLQAGKVQEAPTQYKLPDFDFGYCREFQQASNEFKDLYEVFIKASVDNPQDYQRLRKELETIKNEALKAVEQYQDPKEKAKALYMWLKTRLLKNYDLNKGILAEQVLDKQKYLCLSGAILYTLVANEAKLPVYGMITPGHAFAMLDLGPRDIQIELTAEPMFNLTREEGFDIDWWKQFSVLNRVNAYGGLRQGQTSSRNIGKISPAELTAYQFVNVFADKMRNIKEELKEEQSLVENLRLKLTEQIKERNRSLDNIRKMTDRDASQVQELMLATMDRYDNTIQELEDRIFDVSQRMLTQLTNFEYTQGKELIEKALSISPFTEEFAAIAEGAYVDKAALEIRPVEHAMKKREYERRKLELERQLAALSMRTPEEDDSKKKPTKTKAKGSQEVRDSYREQSESKEQAERKLEKLRIEEKEIWQKERKAWLKAVEVLEEGLKALPCSTKLRRTLENFCSVVVALATRQDDLETRTRIVEIGLKRFPEARFVKEFYEAASE